MNPVYELRHRVGLSQAAFAHRAATSQPTIAAYERGAKSPAFRTLARLAAAVGLEVHATFVPPMTREERRSLALHQAIAARLAADPEALVRRARRNLARMSRESPGARALWREWRQALTLPPPDLADLLVDPRPRARELRHVTPFAGALTAAERGHVYRRFRRSEAERAP